MALPGVAQTPDFFAPATGTTQGEAARDAQVLEQFVVQATQTPGRRWRYATMPGYEILTRCDDAQNAYYLAALEREGRVEAAMLPEGFLTPLAATHSVILYDRQPAAGELAYTIPEPGAVTADDAAVWGRYAGHHLGGSGVGEDVDTRADCLNLWGRSSEQALYTTRSFSTRLLHRTPVLPGWFVHGLIGPAGVYKRGYRFVTPDGAEDRTETFAYFPRALWISEAATAEVQQHPEGVVTLLPLAPLLRSPAAWTQPRSPLESSQIALFVRWGLFAEPQHPDHRAAFLRFVELSATAPADDALFRECFGFGLDHAQTQLRGYLPRAVATGVRLRVTPRGIPAPPALREATKDEVARIIGDWERINALAFRDEFPDLAGKYLSAAGLFLEKRAREGSTDRRFLGVYGLYRHDLGDDAGARRALEAAALDPAARPKVLVTLARLRLNGGPSGPADAATREGIKSLLRASRARPPALAETYRLWAELVRQAPEAPSEEDREVLAEGARLFPPEAEPAASAGQTVRGGTQ